MVEEPAHPYLAAGNIWQGIATENGFVFALSMADWRTAILDEKTGSYRGIYFEGIHCLLEHHDLCDLHWSLLASEGEDADDHRGDLAWLLDNRLTFSLEPIVEEHGLGQPLFSPAPETEWDDVFTSFIYYVRIRDKAQASLFKMFRRLDAGL
jgi:hypothetical protein